jgi:hypothetical protein
VSRDPGPFVFHLEKGEVMELNEPAGEVGFQDLQELLLSQLATTGNVISLTDEELGRLIRYMTRYKSGGFQGHLRNAFTRSLKDLLGL